MTCEYILDYKFRVTAQHSDMLQCLCMHKLIIFTFSLSILPPFELCEVSIQYYRKKC